MRSALLSVNSLLYCVIFNQCVKRSGQSLERRAQWGELTRRVKKRIILGVGSLAQLAEQLTLNQLVDGSIPSRPTNNFKALR